MGSLSSSLPFTIKGPLTKAGKPNMKSCLIVDDSKVIRKVARHILETLEFEVEEAGDGREALSRCEAKMPDVVLLDWNMPVMSGMEFLKLLRQRGHSDQPKVVFCTTENDMAHIRAAMGAGWERVSAGMVETEAGPLLIVDVAALVAGVESRAA